MNAVAIILLLLLLISIVTTILGLIKPSIVRQKSRGKAFGKGLMVSFVLLIAFVYFVLKAADENQSTNQIANNTEQEFQQPKVSEQEQKAEKKEITFTIHHIVDNKGLVSFNAKTNAPENLKLLLLLENAKGESLGASEVTIENGVIPPFLVDLKNRGFVLLQL